MTLSPNQRKLIAPACLCAVLAALLLSLWPASPPDTGSRRVAQSYLDAFCLEDWPRAYATLDLDIQSRVTLGDFTRFAAAYRNRLGFAPETSFILSSRETARDAAASASLGGHLKAKPVTKNITISLRRTPAGWAVRLPIAAFPPETRPSR